jgi:hypothetical protein
LWTLDRVSFQELKCRKGPNVTWNNLVAPCLPSPRKAGGFNERKVGQGRVHDYPELVFWKF